ncbi:MAG TPA: hypothetical protein VHE81_22530, partial [Lacipirellulaceae bacterium]|nr:hypothetical protein [Lacipirellulaceae bacterium]
ATYNGLMFATPLLPKLAEKHPGWSVLYHQPAPGQILYNWPVVAVFSAAAIGAFVWLHRLPYQATREEQLSDARSRQSHHPLAASVPSSAE